MEATCSSESLVAFNALRGVVSQKTELFNYLPYKAVLNKNGRDRHIRQSLQSVMEPGKHHYWPWETHRCIFCRWNVPHLESYIVCAYPGGFAFSITPSRHNGYHLLTVHSCLHSKTSTTERHKRQQSTELSQMQFRFTRNNFKQHKTLHCSWLRHYATSRKVAGSIPDVTGFFYWPNPSSRTMALGSTQPVTEMTTRNFPGGKERPARKADNLTAICEPNA
jgi:hypothetical protein